MQILLIISYDSRHYGITDKFCFHKEKSFENDIIFTLLSLLNVFVFSICYFPLLFFFQAFSNSKLGNENVSVSWFLEDQHSVSEDVKESNVPKVKDVS